MGRGAEHQDTIGWFAGLDPFLAASGLLGICVLCSAHLVCSSLQARRRHARSAPSAPPLGTESFSRPGAAASAGLAPVPAAA